jgi:cysteinyl-tRNA synthetase
MQPLKLYNTYTKKIDIFESLEKNKVSMYCCGPTVYNYQHIGNLRTFLFEDLLKRVLIYNNYDVRHVMNITDVGHLTLDDEGDDKMEESANKNNKTVEEITDYYTNVFLNDLKLLNILPVSVMPKASDYIEAQIEMIRILESDEYTYETPYGIYYDTSMFDDYKKFGNLQEGLEAKRSKDFSEGKRNPTDFALWKFSPKDKQRQMEWNSPWGIGFPGWHIECSAMIYEILGVQIDIHCGGVDHITVHHTNEIAQSQCLMLRRPFAIYWLHGEFLLMGKDKMSKSLNNFITLSDLIERDFTAMDLRYLYLTTHYRKKLNFSEKALTNAKNGLNNLYQKIIDLKELDSTEIREYKIKHELDKFLEIINYDLNIPKALAYTHLTLSNELLNHSEKLYLVLQYDRILGLNFGKLEIEKIPENIIELANERHKFKLLNDFLKADEIRNQIEFLGYKILDQKNEFKILKK